MFYNKDSRAEAEEVAKSSGGVSLSDRHILLIRGTPLLNTSPSEVYRVVPHELFHQVQNQYGKVRTVNWLVEGTPEVFQFVAREKAGFGKVADFVRQAEQIVRQDSAIPDVRELANYQSFHALRSKGHPTYQMSTVMVARLIQDNGFDNIIFFYQLLHNGTAPDKAFITAFRVPMAWFLADMNAYFDKLHANR